MKGLTRAALALMTGTLLSTATPVTGQAPSRATRPDAAERRWTVSRTPDGQPDLQGYWTNATYTPMERPRNITKEFFTEEEYAAFRTYGSVDDQESTDHR